MLSIAVHFSEHEAFSFFVPILQILNFLLIVPLLNALFLIHLHADTSARSSPSTQRHSPAFSPLVSITQLCWGHFNVPIKLNTVCIIPCSSRADSGRYSLSASSTLCLMVISLGEISLGAHLFSIFF